MAEEEKKETEEGAEEATEELQKLLGEAEVLDEEGLGFVAKILRKFKKNKKLAIAAVGALTLAVIVPAYFLSKPKPVEKTEEGLEEGAPGSKGTAKKKEEETAKLKQQQEEAAKLKSLTVYKLAPFFMPLNLGPKESERFVTINLYLLLSNPKLDAELVKNLPMLRENIFSLLKRKKPIDFIQDKKKVEQRLRQEIVTLANTLILSGSGTINDVYFTEFIVK